MTNKTDKSLPRQKAPEPEAEKINTTIKPVKEKPSLYPTTIRWILDADGFPTGGKMPEVPDDGWENIISPRYRR